VLSGAAVGNAVGSMYKHMDRPQDVGHFFCLLDISAFMDVDQMKQRTDSMIDGIKGCRRRDGVEEILIPGESKFRQVQENSRRGVPLGPETVEELRVLAAEYHLPFTLEPTEASPASGERG
jgi:LDH2 family malate/lactate/ureidoglycolate dehydrogenase